MVALQTPVPLGPTHLARLAEHHIIEQERAAMPVWHAAVLAQRWYFRSTAFVIEHEGAEQVWKFIYAKGGADQYMAVSLLEEDDDTYIPYCSGQK